MLRDFAQFVQSIFPVIDPAVSRAFLKAHSKYAPVWPDLWASAFPENIAQGDILDPITFVTYDADGAYEEWVGPGMLLSHSCDVVEGDKVLFATCRSMNDYRGLSFESTLPTNTIFRFFYLESVPSLGDSVVDFGFVQSAQRDMFVAAVQQGTVRRVSSFTQFGYWLLIAKLTIHLLRPSPPDERRGVAVPAFRERLSGVVGEMAILVRYLFRTKRA
jgi:hypothetical protein